MFGLENLPCDLKVIIMIIISYIVGFWLGIRFEKGKK